MSQSLIKKAFCFAQYSCIGRLVARSVLNGKVNPNHDVYRNTDPIHLDVFRQLSIHEKSVEKLYEIFCEIDRDGSGEISIMNFRFFGINVFLIGLNFLKYLKLLILMAAVR